MSNLLDSFLLFLLIGLISCSSPDNQTTADEQSEFCANQLSLLRGSKEKSFPFPFYLTGLERFQYFEAALDTSCCNNILRCNTHLINSITDTLPIQLFLYRSCSGEPIGTMPNCGIRSTVELLINSHHQLLFEGQIATIDSLPDMTCRAVLNEINLDLSRIALSIQVDSAVTTNKYISCYDAIIRGYLSAMDTLSHRKFNRTVCELTQAEIDHLRPKFKMQMYHFPPPTPVVSAISCGS